MKFYVKDYPRPQFVRNNWENLNGTWDFKFDDDNVGECNKWYENFEGSDFYTTLWVNGKKAGSHKGGYARFSFDT